jgi:hypothetical protein
MCGRWINVMLESDSSGKEQRHDKDVADKDLRPESVLGDILHSLG